MLGALRLILAVTGRRAGAYGEHAKARVAHVALLTALGAAAAVFLVALATVALAQWLGVLAALAIMAGVCVAGCLGVLVAMRAERRAHRAALARQELDERRVVQAALLTALPGLRRGGLVAAALGGIALLLVARRDGDDRRK